MNSRTIINLLFVFALCFAGCTAYAENADVDVTYYDQFGRIYGIRSGKIETTVAVTNKTDENISVMAEKRVQCELHYQMDP